jgi:hypothetical protein
VLTTPEALPISGGATAPSAATGVYEVRIEQGRCTTSEGRAARPDVVMTMDVETLNRLLLEGLPSKEALADRRVELQGDPQALERFVTVFPFQRRGARPDGIEPPTS